MHRKSLLALALCLYFATSAFAEGFNMTEWSARGLGLAGGMVGRADDVSALSYNAAGITQLPGTHFMLGATAIHPHGEHKAYATDPMTGKTEYVSSSLKYDVWTPPHAYISNQLNDSLWLGLGVFTRYGLGISYKGDWFGRYNVYDVGLSTVSAVPTIAYKINDMISISAGIEFMYLDFYEDVKVPTYFGTGRPFDNAMEIRGTGLGIGGHFGLHMRFNEQWSVGLTYKTQVTQNVSGEAEFHKTGRNLLPNSIAKQYNCNASSTIQFPDSIALGIAYKPLENLSFEVGTVWTRWSTFNHLNMYFDEPSGYRSLNEKQWRDGWNFNASVEYKPLDWLTLRAGYWYETPVVNKTYADFMVPSYGRDVLTLGAGFTWENWTLDVAYAHIWIHQLDYSKSQATGLKGIVHSSSNQAASDLYSLSLSYSF